ncbi:MAG: hypothetical protein QME79_06605 [Bacillota bacterium]|nr:hypothetical protein [Bacillota bacterium]
MRRKHDIEEEEVGSRSYGVERSRAVEAAVARLRHGLKEQWGLFVPEELKALEWILGEAWAVTGSRGWEQIGFNYAPPELVEQLIALGEKAQAGELIRLSAAREAKRLLSQLPPPGEAPDLPEES